ncbi:MAG: Na+/H+ antiporter NhaC family protein [Desulfovibrionaceae bacterium]|nr:Na+/H+ antiporter NhaC family protein [Desulfovibrionaceae bacterium]
MDNAGYLAFLPPILAIVLALFTKDVLVSLMLGIISGLLILSGGNPLDAFINLSDLMADKAGDSWNIRILLFCGLLGGLVGLLTRAGSARAFGQWASNSIKGRRSAQFSTWLCGLFVFIDDYFNSLAVGSVMRPVNDARGVSRAKLAYILDSTAAPVCILAPVSSWVVTVISQIRSSDGFADLGVGEMSFFIMLIPYNVYALLALAMVVVVILSGRDFGPMAKSEQRAAQGILYNQQRYGAAPGDLKEEGKNSRAAWYDMALPMIILIGACIVAFPLTTYMGLGEGESMSLVDAFRNTDASKALLYGIIFTLVFSYVYFTLRGVLKIKETSQAIIDGVRSMLPALVILIMAWTIGHVISKPISEGGLGLPLVIDEMLRGSSLPLWVLPACVFVLSGGIAFSTGTSWGTFGIMSPIVLPTAITLAGSLGYTGDELLQCSLVSVGAVLSGAVFGDHASPISDTTILSSAGASCPHLEHVETQLPYASFAAGCSAVGIIAGAYSLNPVVGLLTAVACFVPGFFFLTRGHKRS